MNDVPTPGIGPCSCCGEPGIGVCNCPLSQPVSEVYCASCLERGIDAWWIVLATVASCSLGYGHEPTQWREVMAPWAVGIVERSLAFYEKTEQQMLDEVMAMERDAGD